MCSFKTNNLEIIARAAEVLDVPLALLVGYVDEPDVCDLPIIESCISEQSGCSVEIWPEDVPMGDSVGGYEEEAGIDQAILLLLEEAKS